MLANLAGSASAVTLLRTAAQEGTAPKFVAAPPGSAAPITGLCIDIMRAIERVEPAVRFVGDQTWMPLARVEAELLAGYQDAAFCLVRNAAREAQTIFIEPPLYSVDFVLAVRADDDIRIRSWDDVRKLDKASIVLAMHNSGAINRVSGEGASIAFDTSAKTPEQNLKKLMAGRGRFFYHRKPGLEGEIRRAGLEGKVRILSPPMDSTLSYLVLGKHVPQETVEKIRKAVAQLHASGELARIFEKWDTE